MALPSPVQAASDSIENMRREFDEISARLREAEETLDAIRNGEVDAVVVGGPAGQQVYTLENADRPYRVLIERMQEGAVTFGGDGTILYCNQCFAKILKEARETLIGKNIAGFLRGDESNAFLTLLARGAGSPPREYLLHDKESIAVRVNISLVELQVEDGGDRVVCGVATDLTHTRRRSDELEEANLKLAGEIDERRRAQSSLQLALDAAGMGSWDLDLLTNAARRSPRHDQIFGYADLQQRWSLQTTLDHFVDEDRPAVAQAFIDGERSGTIDFEARISRASDGLTRWLHVKGQTYVEADRPVRIAGVVADVTDHREVQEQLRQAQKIEAIGQLTGGVAHDFNNLLMVISGGLDLIGRQNDAARRERILGGMRQAVQRGSTLSRQLLAFSRRQALQPEPIDLARQIGGMQELLDRSLRGDVHVTTKFAPDLWPVEVDPGELELVILNLAVNARDAMPNGGMISIQGENAPDLAEAELSGDFVRLSIVDTGTGMPPEVVARAFEPFFTTKDIGKGSGLGLAQTHGFAQESGGAVQINSVFGKGTTVAILLPRTHKKPLVSDHHLVDLSSAPIPEASSGQVLLVEDDDEVAALTVEMIHQLGYTTTRVATADAALGALANGRSLDLVFSDIMMPGNMDGIELAQEIHRRRPDLPVLLTSGYAEAAQQRAEAQSIKILPKPFRLEELGSMLAAVRGRTH